MLRTANTQLVNADSRSDNSAKESNNNWITTGSAELNERIMIWSVFVTLAIFGVGFGQVFVL